MSCRLQRSDIQQWNQGKWNTWSGNSGKWNSFTFFSFAFVFSISQFNCMVQIFMNCSCVERAIHPDVRNFSFGSGTTYSGNQSDYSVNNDKHFLMKSIEHLKINVISDVRWICDSRVATIIIVMYFFLLFNNLLCLSNEKYISDHVPSIALKNFSHLWLCCLWRISSVQLVDHPIFWSAFGL